MNGIDIASYQADIDLTKVDADFVIIKITQGDYYYNPDFASKYDQAVKSGKLVGMYHYSNGVTPVSIEVDHLLKYAKPYIGKCMICLDWESNGTTKRAGYNPKFAKGVEVAYVMEFVSQFYEKTSVFPVIYMSASVTRRSDWQPVAKRCPLWVAQYKNDAITSYQDKPWRDTKGLGAWDKAIIHQYSPSGTIKGYEQIDKHKLDMDICHISKNEWLKIQNPNDYTFIAKEITPELIKDILDGKYGTGVERREKLSNAGYSSMQVQTIINMVLEARKNKDAYKEKLGKFWDIV